MRTQEFCERSGLSRDTVRFYERRGLLQPAREASGNGYKCFAEADLDRARMIAYAKRCGMRLSLIGEHLDAYASGSLAGEALREVFEEQLRLIRERRAALDEAEAYVREKLERVCETA